MRGYLVDIVRSLYSKCLYYNTARVTLSLAIVKTEDMPIPDSCLRPVIFSGKMICSRFTAD